MHDIFRSRMKCGEVYWKVGFNLLSLETTDSSRGRGRVQSATKIKKIKSFRVESSRAKTQFVSCHHPLAVLVVTFSWPRGTPMYLFHTRYLFRRCTKIHCLGNIFASKQPPYPQEYMYRHCSMLHTRKRQHMSWVNEGNGCWVCNIRVGRWVK